MCNKICLSCGLENDAHHFDFSNSQFDNACFLSSNQTMIFHCNNCDNYSIVYRPSFRELLKCIQDNGRIFFPTNERVTFLTDEHSLGDEATKLMLGNLFKSALISLERTIPMVTGEYLFVSPRQLIAS